MDADSPAAFPRCRRRNRARLAVRPRWCTRGPTPNGSPPHSGAPRLNEILGVRRWTAVLAYPAVFIFVPLTVYALTRRTFVWVAGDTAGMGNLT